MSELFTSDFYRANRERLRHLFTGTAPIVITANGLLQRGTDEPFTFHQDRSFYYLTGINDPGIILVMDKGKEYLVVPPREVVVEQFDGVIDFDELRRISGVQDIVYAKEGWKQLHARLKKVQHVATLGAAPRFIEYLGMYTNPARADMIQHIKDENPHIEVLDLRQHLSRMRMVKQEPEIAAIQRAIDAANATLKEIIRPKQLAKYAYEYEIEADLSHGFRSRGMMGHAFTPVVAGGKRACIMHNMSNGAPLVSGELLLMDVGAEYAHYASDIARTISLGGQPSRRQQQVHDAVTEAQEYAYSLLKPGLILRAYEKQMEDFMGEKLRELGLIKTINREQVRHYFPHATSHFLGLDTHDSGDYDHPLEPGVVITVEPGIYIPEEEIGVRIEDDILITADGNKNLSAALSHDLA
jgi:Xaa-Pro aminopeptidase